MHWSDSLTEEQLESKRASSRKYNREKRWAAIGASPEYYAERLAEQEGLCSICGTARNPCRGVKREDEFFCIDHDHETGILRGLLCTPCDLVIGNAKDDPDILRSAIAYLEYWEAVT